MDRITPSGEPGSVASGLINAKGKSIAVTERLHKALRLQHLLDEKVRLHSRISRHSLVSLFSAAGFLMPDIRNNAVLLGGFTGFLLRHAHQAALSMQELRVFKRRYA